MGLINVPRVNTVRERVNQVEPQVTTEETLVTSKGERVSTKWEKVNPNQNLDPLSARIRGTMESNTGLLRSWHLNDAQ
ncbi:hypothetical protein [Psychrobacillus sp. OK028]|uniref:hypothetical protein n=1 Tax=Psychrobacillus sp. OK028 TaxID=1884359 RepID=UPI0011146BAB|nr:hypothetical protein [Psychrobacillus sp. OK028]